MKKQRLPRDLAVLGILTVLTVFTWISLDVYRTLRQQSTPPKVPAEQIEPLDPKLETRIIESLSKRVMYEKEDLLLSPTSPVIATESGEKKKS